MESFVGFCDEVLILWMSSCFVEVSSALFLCPLAEGYLPLPVDKECHTMHGYHIKGRFIVVVSNCYASEARMVPT